MKLSKKIVISFMIIAVFPITVMFCLIIGVGRYQINLIEDKYDIEIGSYENLYNSVGILDQITNNVRCDIQNIKEDNPDKLLDTAYLEELNNKLTRKYTYIIVRKGDELIFNGLDDDYSNIQSIIPDYSDAMDSLEETLYISGQTQYLVKTELIQFNENSAGVVYIISRINNSLPEIRKMITAFFIMLVVITIFTGVVLTLWIYKGILQPVKVLKKAANEIGNGNLDCEIKQYKNNEFGELSEAFEEMRKHLKLSIEENIHNDEENKELISNISHDLKTPITAIKGYVEGIMDGVADSPEKMDKYIKTIYNKANDMDRLIGELTIYSRIDCNKIPYNFVKLNLEDYFNDCVDEINTDLDAIGIKLTYINYVERDVMVIADPEQLKRVINNIISNSVKYMDKQEGFVGIRIQDEDDFVHVEMEDNGKGVGADELPYIFDRFYRTDASRNSKQGGSGIGLAIAKKIIEAHGGRIWASSKKGSGTTIHFILRKIIWAGGLYEQDINSRRRA